MKRSSSTDVQRKSHSIQEKLRQVGQSTAAGLSGQLRTSDPKWLLIDRGFTLAREHETESLFAIANGYIGNRGSLAEGSPLSAPATFVAGVFQQLDIPSSVPELMVLPDWTGVRIWVHDEPLSMQHGDVLQHRRILDFRRGILWREWRHRDPAGRITQIVAFRLASLADRHLMFHSVTLTPENHTSVIRFESSIEATDRAVSLLAPGWKTRRDSTRPNVLPLGVCVPGRNTTVAFGLTSQMLHSARSGGCRTMHMHIGKITEHCEIEVKAGTDCHLHRVVSVFTSRDGGDPFQWSMEHLRDAVTKGAESAVWAHVSAWESRWKATDIEIEGDDSLQQALRFAAYHLISAANTDDTRVSIGARTLSGAGYKGHVFWDTEIYMVPFFIFTHPRAARALLEYRYHTLDAARRKARASGFRGAMYPWESADTGDETTPKAVFMPNGELLETLNAEMEVHVTADIAFAIWQYWHNTGDDEFLVRYGAEIMLESARFWASRGAIENDGFYHIRHVIGPDEYHENVDDDAYTNLMASWNLRRAAEAAKFLEEHSPRSWQDLAAQLQLSGEEISTWPKLAAAMFVPFDRKTRIYEQFSGYFDKEAIDLRSYEPRSAAMDTILGHERIQKTNIVKQADVVLATFLLWDEIGSEVSAANFRYYEPRTGHGSSLSPSIHALIAARIGDTERAQSYLKQAAEIDLGNNMGNAASGVHAAALGGLWQAVVFGIAGIRTHLDGISLEPKLLPSWQRLCFPLQWRGRKLRVCIEPESVCVGAAGDEPFRLRLEGGSEIVAIPGQEYVAKKELRWGGWRIAHSSSKEGV